MIKKRYNLLLLVLCIPLLANEKTTNTQSAQKEKQNQSTSKEKKAEKSKPKQRPKKIKKRNNIF